MILYIFNIIIVIKLISLNIINNVLFNNFQVNFFY